MQRKLRIAWVSISTIMLLLLGVEVATQLKLIRDREEEVHAWALRLAHGVETEQWRLVDDVQHIAGTLVTVGSSEILGNGCQGALERLRRDIPEYLTVEVMEKEGFVRCATDGRAIGAFIGDRENVRNALSSGGFAIGGYSIARKIGRPVLTFAQPLSQPDGRPAGVVTLLLDLGWLDAYLSRNPPPPGAMVMMADRSGQVLAQTEARVDGVGQPLPDALRFMLDADHQGVVDIDWPGLGKRVVAYVPPRVRLPGILFIMALDRDAAMGPAYAAMWRTLAVFGGVLTLCYAFAIWSMRNLIRVQESLVLALEAGRAGTTDQDLENERWHWSAETYRIFGLDPKCHVAGFDTWKSVLHPDDRRRVLAAREALLAARARSVDMEYRVLRPGGEVVWVQLVGRIYYAADGKPQRFTGLYIDVTARKTFEEELRVSREHMKMALAAANAGAWEWRLPDNKIIWSDEVYRQRGLDPAATGKPTKELWLSTVHPEDRAAFLNEIEAVLAKRRETLGIEIRVQLPDKSIRWINRSGRVFYDAHGQPERMVGISLDVTARKEAEAGLRTEKEEAERASLAKSKFLAAASHDLRQPVQSMILFAHVLDAQLREHPASQVVKKLMAAQDSLKTLLDSLLDLTKLDAGLVTPHMQSVSASTLLEQLATAYQMRAAEKGLKFRVRICDAWVRTDPTLFARILSNLLDNALKYTPQGGVLLTCRPVDGDVRFDVVDTGVGIAREHIGEVFREFVQVGESGREQKQGMGLGLATVKRLAELLGHRLKVHSRPGRGSCFSVIAAADSPSPRVSRVHAKRPASGGHKRILVVDDEQAILDGMEVMLQQWGYEPITANTLDGAMNKVARAGAPDALVVDFRLGAGVTGVDVVRAVRDAIGRKVPTILLTGDTALDMNGDFMVLYKPVSPEQLNRTLAEVCNGVPASDGAVENPCATD